MFSMPVIPEHTIRRNGGTKPLDRRSTPQGPCVPLSSTPMERTARTGVILALCVVALGTLAYANSFQGAFVFDDVVQILDNPSLRDPVKLLRGAEGFQVQPNRFVPYLSFAANVRLGGLT